MEEPRNNIDLSYPLSYTERHIPFDQRRHKQVWPNGARMAVMVIMSVEEWCWDKSEITSPPGTKQAPGEKLPSLSTRSAIQYGFDIGLPRFLEDLEKCNIKATFWTTGNAAEQHEAIIKRISDSGHEVNAHAYTQGTPLTLQSREAQRANIQKTVQILSAVTGKRPLGWGGPGALCNQDTVELLAEEGFEFHADLQGDELPYFIDVKEATLVEIPFRMVGIVNDYTFMLQIRSPEESLNALKSVFDAYYRAAGERPMHFIIGTHPFVIGRPDCSYVFTEFIHYIQRYQDIWLTTYGEVANWWTQNFNEK